ncbi:hypothetical protein R80B4_02492 [Fibrobacteres bacterium R8-0-B4]
MQKQYGVLNAHSRRDIAPRMTQHVLKKTSSHWGYGVINDMPQGSLSLAAVQPDKNLQIGFRNFINKKASAQVQQGKGLQMIHRAHLRLFQIKQQCSASTHQFVFAVQIQNTCVSHALNLQDPLGSSFEVKMPLRHMQHTHTVEPTMPRYGIALGEQKFAGGNFLYPLPEIRLAIKFNPGPLSGGNVCPDKAAVTVCSIIIKS